MKRLFVILSGLFLALSASGQDLPAAWEELTSPDFVKATQKSEGVCIIPMGVIEKHGPHLPLGTDVFTARAISLKSASTEYCIVYPFYFAGQIFEAKQQPGTIAYSPELLYKMLDETCKEIARNGIKKILLVNGHGGNTNFLQYFCQSQLAEAKDYAVYLFTPSVDAATRTKITSMRKSATGGHADEEESSVMMLIKPDLVKKEQATSQSGVDQNRLQLPNAYTAIWWYAKYPNHYAGDAKDADAELGKVIFDQHCKQLSEVIKAVKADKVTQKLQNDFYQESASPQATKVKQ